MQGKKEVFAPITIITFSHCKHNKLLNYPLLRNVPFPGKLATLSCCANVENFSMANPFLQDLLLLLGANFQTIKTEQATYTGRTPFLNTIMQSKISITTMKLVRTDALIRLAIQQGHTTAVLEGQAACWLLYQQVTFVLLFRLLNKLRWLTPVPEHSKTFRIHFQSGAVISVYANVRSK